MKKMMFTAAALLVLAASTFQIANVNATVVAGTTKPKSPTTSSSTIPPPTCPPNDPNGCGIFD